MNNYPVWWDTSITVFNKHTDNTTQLVTWYRHTVTGAFWQYVRDKATLGDVVLETNKTICRIREDEDFMEKHLWIALSDEEKLKHFTLGQGDIIVKGEVEDTIDEYSKNQRSSDLIAKYKELQGCFEIEAVSINVGPGRGLPHYRVQGV